MITYSQMKARLVPAMLAASLLAGAIMATPATDREWATRVKCEIQSAGGDSLPPQVWQQGTMPLLSLDQYRQGKAIDADTNATAIVRFGPTATSAYFISVTNYATSGNGFLVQLPTLGTNTQYGTSTASNWWYTAYFERDGKRYWTGNGRVQILATTSTGDGLTWQTVTGGTVAGLQAAQAGYSNHVRQVYLRGVEAEAGVWQIYVGD